MSTAELPEWTKILALAQQIHPSGLSFPWSHLHLHGEVICGAASVHGESCMRRNTVGRGDFGRA